jgi:hypothetical protein
MNLVTLLIKDHGRPLSSFQKAAALQKKTHKYCEFYEPVSQHHRDHEQIVPHRQFPFRSCLHQGQMDSIDQECLPSEY